MKKHLLDTDVKEVDIMVGLILEGGGSRGAYTAGVLDVLAENDIYLPVTYGVSAGACNALSYLSKQKKRNYRILTEFASDKRYSGIGLFLKTGNLFGFDFIFGELACDILPYDFKEFEHTSMKLRVSTTDCVTGKPVFFENDDIMNDFIPVIASSSLPVVSKIVEYKNYKLLDGGVAAPIPIEYAVNDGITKNIIVLTRDRSYVKKNKTDFPLFYLKSKYKKYPALIEAMVNRAAVYNREKNMCYAEQENNNAIVIEPSKPIEIGRSCKKSDVLDEIYQLGVHDAEEKLVDINRFIALNT